MVCQIKKAGFDVACIMLILILFSNLSRSFNKELPPIDYQRLIAYGGFLILTTAVLRHYKRSLAQLFVNALWIGTAASMAGEIRGK